jgi:hypothetical protein
VTKDVTDNGLHVGRVVEPTLEVVANAPPGNVAPDTTAPDTTAPDTTAPDTTASDTTAPDTTAPPEDSRLRSGTEPVPDAARFESPWISVLYPSRPDRDISHPTPVPDSLDDLGLYQVFLSIVSAGDRDQLLPYYLATLSRVDEVEFRHEVWRDLDGDRVVEALSQFAHAIHDVHLRLQWSRDTRFDEERLSWHLDASLRYCRALRSLVATLNTATVRSRGLCGVRTYLTNYLGDDSFVAFEAQSEALRQRLDRIQYSLTIRGARVRVAAFENDDEYAAEIRTLFERFNRGGAITTYRVGYRDSYGMNHVEAQIAQRVAKLFPSEFTDLRAFVARYSSFVTDVIERCVTEFAFYVGYHHFVQQFRNVGLHFTLPNLTQPSDECDASEAFDVALGMKLLSSATTSPTAMVTNGFHLAPSKRIIVVSGPNQGGKTTFARLFGQLHYLAALGLPVPGTHATLSLVDEVFTHFSRSEDNTAQAGKLEQDLLRMKAILERATPSSVIVANEVFSSTTVSDALSLGTTTLRHILEHGSRAVYVSFVDELSRLDPAIVSMVSTINPENPVERTYRIVQRAADGRAYALAIAAKYGLTYDQVRERLSR